MTVKFSILLYSFIFFALPEIPDFSQVWSIIIVNFCHRPHITLGSADMNGDGVFQVEPFFLVLNKWKWQETLNCNILPGYGCDLK